jgi:hypothetical protein
LHKRARERERLSREIKPDNNKDRTRISFLIIQSSLLSLTIDNNEHHLNDCKELGEILQAVRVLSNFSHWFFLTFHFGNAHILRNLKASFRILEHLFRRLELG